MIRLKSRFAGPNSPIIMLVVAGACALLFTLVAGVLVYNSTRNLITAAAWVDHTHEVLSSLQDVSQLFDIIDYDSQIFFLRKDEASLRAARLAANQLTINSAHIGLLVLDNINQKSNADRLEQCASDLTHSLYGLSTLMASPANQLQHCRNNTDRMALVERRLLVERSQTSRHRSLVSFTTESVFLGLSLVTLVTLFGFLLRDAVHRQRISRTLVSTNQDLATMVKALEDQANESNLLTAFRDELQLCVNLEQVYGSASASFSLLLPCSAGALCIINSSRNLLEVVSTWGESAMGNFNAPESCCGLRSGQPRWREPGGSVVNCSHFVGPPPEHYLCMPVIAHGETLGILSVQCADESSCSLIRLRMEGLRQLLQLSGLAVASLNLRSKLENQSIRDPLTGLFNRHFMQIALDRELSRADRRDSVLAVFMLDIDHFKQFNDTWGHAAGDAVLKATADVYQNIVRDEDIVCRYGGEEFTIILPDITPEIAFTRAESIRQAVAELRVLVGREQYVEVKVSIGIALYPSDGRGADNLLHRADEALYRAKRQGRNQVSLSGPLITVPDAFDSKP
ncbi:MAG TPA: GGDEF domain-containing protein [Acidisarcina sp.]